MVSNMQDKQNTTPTDIQSQIEGLPSRTLLPERRYDEATYEALLKGNMIDKYHVFDISDINPIPSRKSVNAKYLDIDVIVSLIDYRVNANKLCLQFHNNFKNWLYNNESIALVYDLHRTMGTSPITIRNNIAYVSFRLVDNIIKWCDSDAYTRAMGVRKERQERLVCINELISESIKKDEIIKQLQSVIGNDQPELHTIYISVFDDSQKSYYIGMSLDHDTGDYDFIDEDDEHDPATYKLVFHTYFRTTETTLKTPGLVDMLIAKGTISRSVTGGLAICPGYTQQTLTNNIEAELKRLYPDSRFK